MIYRSISHKQLSKDLILTMELRMLNALGSISLVTAYDISTLLIENIRADGKEKEMKREVRKQTMHRLYQTCAFKDLVELKPSTLAERCVKNAIRSVQRSKEFEFEDLKKRSTGEKGMYVPHQIYAALTSMTPYSISSNPYMPMPESKNQQARGSIGKQFFMSDQYGIIVFLQQFGHLLTSCNTTAKSEWLPS